MSAVWEDAPYDAGALLVLLALSDYANDAGECWPNVSSIAVKTRLGVRQVHNILRQLKSDGAISIKPGGGRGVSNRYQIHAETLKSISVKSDSVKPISVKSATETVQSIAQNSAICDIAIRKNRQEPSIEPSLSSFELESSSNRDDFLPALPMPGKFSFQKPSHEAERLSELLKGEILKNSPTFRITPAQERKWAVTADRMLRLDHRTPEEIAELIRWVQKDDFWMGNVLSMDTLRKKFDQLQLKRKPNGQPLISRAERATQEFIQRHS